VLLINSKLDVSKIHGIGLFSEEYIPKGTIVWNFHKSTCDVFTLKEFYNLCHELPFVGIKNFLNYSYIKNNKVYYISDNTRFINHSDNPNLALVNEFCEITIRDIYPGEELLENYFESYDEKDFFCIENLHLSQTREELLKTLRESFVDSKNILETITG
jgi:uncharacterized protein